MANELIVESLYFKDILKDINFKLKGGSINALMGKNGSGKTLIFKSIFGLVDSNGTVSINQITKTKDNADEFKTNIGIYLGIKTLQTKTVFSNIIEILNNLNYDEEKAKNKIYQLAKKLDIENILYKNVEKLSHSQKKVVSFAQTVIHEPKILLLDGIFESLDNHYKNKIVTYLKQLKKNKKSIILFTTNDSENLWLAENLLIVKNGKLVCNKSIEELLEDENMFLKNDIKLPFLVDLSYKLKAYDLIDRLIYDLDEMVDEIWR